MCRHTCICVFSTSKSDKFKKYLSLLSEKQKLSWKCLPANRFHPCVLRLLLASQESEKSRIVVGFISTLNKMRVILIKRKSKSRSRNYLSEFSAQGSLGPLNYSIRQASELSARAPSHILLGNFQITMVENSWAMHELLIKVFTPRYFCRDRYTVYFCW